MGYRVRVRPIGPLWEYEIVLEKGGYYISVGRGYRGSETEARNDGVSDMNMARTYGVGQAAFQYHG